MPVYMIAEATEIMNAEKHGEYIRNVPETVEKYGGRYIARGGDITVISGGWNPTRLIIIKFNSMDAFNAWLNSPEYRSVAPLREQSARVNAVVLEGI